MSVYMIIDIQVLDPVCYSEYIEQVAQVIEKFGGRYLVRGGNTLPLTKNWNPERIVVIEFKTLADQKACFSSAEYRKIAPLREQSTIGRSIVVEGCE